MEKLEKKLTSLQKIVVTSIAIIGAVWVAGWQAIEAIDARAEAREERRIEEIREVLHSEGLLTAEEFIAVTDSIFTEIEVNRITNDTFHLRGFKERKEMLFAIGQSKYEDSTVQLRIDEIERLLNEIRGVSTATHLEQSQQAYTDSLQNELLLIKQNQSRTMLMRQLDQQHREEMNRIRDLSKDIVIDKGRRKTIRSKPKGAKQGRVTEKSKNLF